MLTIKNSAEKKITVTCTCGEEVEVPIKVAGAVLASQVVLHRDKEKNRKALEKAREAKRLKNK